MHNCTQMPVRKYLVTLCDRQRNAHVIQVDSPCACDMRDYVSKIEGLPITPAFMSVVDLDDMVEMEPLGVAS